MIPTVPALHRRSAPLIRPRGCKRAGAVALASLLTPAVASQPARAAAARPWNRPACARAGDRPGCGGPRSARHSPTSPRCTSCVPSPQGDLAARFVAKATPVAQIRRALLEARAAEDEATAIRSQVRPATVEPAQPAIDTAAIYAARNQHCR